MDELISAEAVVCTLIMVGATQAALSAVSMCRQQQYFLAAWLACFALEVASKGLLFLRIAPNWSQWLGYWFSFDIIYGPLLLLWVLFLINPAPLSKWHLLHFIPALFYLYLTVPEALALSESTRMERINNYLDFGDWVSYSQTTMDLLSGLLWHPYAYVFIALGCLIWRRKTTPKLIFRWLLSMLVLHVVMWCVVIFGMLWVPWSLPLVFLTSYLPAVIWINLLAWVSLSFLQLRRADMANQDNEELATPTVPQGEPEKVERALVTEEKAKYQHTRLDKEQQKQIASQLEDLMAQHIYTQSRLSLADVAQLIGIAPHYVSQVINDYYQCNFADYINRYRLTAIKQQLSNPNLQQNTILDIALSNGFNSKTAFNTAFKKDTGVTPSQYRKQKQRENCEADLA